jgi:hypothetical protein
MSMPEPLGVEAPALDEGVKKGRRLAPLRHVQLLLDGDLLVVDRARLRGLTERGFPKAAAGRAWSC